MQINTTRIIVANNGCVTLQCVDVNGKRYQSEKSPLDAVECALLFEAGDDDLRNWDANDLDAVETDSETCRVITSYVEWLEPTAEQIASCEYSIHTLNSLQAIPSDEIELLHPLNPIGIMAEYLK